jgi:hypothetical protein
LRLRTETGREALRQAELSPAGRELVALGLRMLDSFDLELAPLDRQLRAFARRQPGCRALIERLYGVGPVSATAILAELGDWAASPPQTTPSVTPASTSPSTSPTTSAPPDASRTRGPSCCAGRCTKRPSRPPAPAHPITPTTAKSPSGSTTTAPACRSPASSAGAPTTSSANSARRRSRRSSSQPTRRRSQLPPNPVTTNARERPRHPRCSAAGSPRPPAAGAHRPGRPRETERPQATPRGDHTRSIILSPDHLCPCTQVRLGVPRAPRSATPPPTGGHATDSAKAVAGPTPHRLRGSLTTDKGVGGLNPPEGFDFLPAQLIFPLSVLAAPGGVGVHAASTSVHRGRYPALSSSRTQMPASIRGEFGPRARDGQHVRCSAAAVFRGSSPA